MPLAQEWLDANYPNKEARRVQLVDLTGLNLTGDLDVTDFFTTDWDFDREREIVKGTKFIITGNPNLGKIIDRKWNKSEFIITIAQEYLDYWYPKNGTCLRENERNDINNYGKRRNGITRLYIANQQLTGELDLSDFVGLTNLDCFSNQLTNLILPANSQIEWLNCQRNSFLKSDFLLDINWQKLTTLYLDDNSPTGIELKSHLQLGEKLVNKSTSDLVLNLNEVNWITLLTRRRQATQQATKKVVTPSSSSPSINIDPAPILPDSSSGSSLLATNSVSAQGYIDQHYHDRIKRKEVEIVDLTNLDLTGDLVVSDFSYNTRFIITGNPQLRIIDRKEWGKTKILQNAQEWLEKWYPQNGTCCRENEISNFGKRREEITRLDISNQGLTSELDCSSFIGLTELIVSNNQLTKLILPANNQLEKLDCYGNQHLQFDFLLNLDLEKISYLNLDDNSLVFSELVKHKRIWERITKLSRYKKEGLENLTWTNIVSYITLLERWKKTNQQTQVQLPQERPEELEQQQEMNQRSVSNSSSPPPLIKLIESLDNSNTVDIEFTFPTQLTNFLTSLSEEKLLNFLRSRMVNIGDLINQFLDARELVTAAPTERAKVVADKLYGQAKSSLVQVLTQPEIIVLTKSNEEINDINPVIITFSSTKLVEFLSSLKLTELISFLTVRDANIKPLLDDYLGNQDLLAEISITQRARELSQRDLDRTKETLFSIISQEELTALEIVYRREHQTETEFRTETIRTVVEERPPAYTEPILPI